MPVKPAQSNGFTPLWYV